MLGYNTKDPRKGSLLKLNDYLELVVPKKGGDFGPTLELGSETSNTLLQANLASPWLRLGMKLNAKQIEKKLKNLIVVCVVVLPLLEFLWVVGLKEVWGEVALCRLRRAGGGVLSFGRLPLLGFRAFLVGRSGGRIERGLAVG